MGTNEMIIFISENVGSLFIFLFQLDKFGNRIFFSSSFKFNRLFLILLVKLLLIINRYLQYLVISRYVLYSNRRQLQSRNT